MATPTVSEHYEGMPQLDPAFMPNLVFWLVVTMVVLYVIINRVAIPRISGTIEDRHEVISNDLEAAADLKKKAEQAEAAYHKALAEARAEAQRIGAETKAEINKELEAATAKADAEIAAKTAESEERIAEIRESARESIEQVANDTARALVEALMPGAEDDAAIKAAVDSSMKGA
jgi:F-type H+-transporting ATPase subunit b